MHIDRLPQAGQIDYPLIAEAAERHAQAQTDLKDAQRAVARLDGTVQLGRIADADADADAHMAGKPAPKRRQEEAARTAIEEAEYAIEVARAVVVKARAQLQDALDVHGPEWLADLDEHAALIDEAWSDQLAALVTLYADRVQAHRLRAALGGHARPSATVRLSPSQLIDSVSGQRLELARLDDAGQRWRQRALVNIADVLGALQTADEPEEIPAFIPGGGVAEQIARAAEHAQAVARGQTVEEARSDAPIRLNDGHYLEVDGRRFALHLPTGRDED